MHASAETNTVRFPDPVEHLPSWFHRRSIPLLVEFRNLSQKRRPNFTGDSGMPDFLGLGPNEYGTHIEFVNRNCVLGQLLRRLGAIWGVGNAIRLVGPEVAKGLRQYSDVAESFYPIRSIPSGDD